MEILMFLALLLLLEADDPIMKGKPIIVFDRIDKSGRKFWAPLIELMEKNNYSSYFTVVNELDQVIPTVHRLIDNKA